MSAAGRLDHPDAYLRKEGERQDGPHDIAMSALMLAKLDHPAQAIEPYVAHIEEIAAVARADADRLSDVDDSVRHLARTLAGRFGYDGDRLNYDDPRNADLMSVIDRRRGMPVALGILYLHAARASGWHAEGLNSPGHFLIRIVVGGRGTILDPFNGDAPSENGSFPPRTAAGDIALAAVSDRDVLLRLLNNLKIRSLEKDDRARAVEIVRRMTLIAPRQPEVWFDMARLHEASGSLGAARQAYESCLSCAPGGKPLHNEAALALAMLKRRLN